MQVPGRSVCAQKVAFGTHLVSNGEEHFQAPWGSSNSQQLKTEKDKTVQRYWFTYHIASLDPRSVSPSWAGAGFESALSATPRSPSVYCATDG